MVTVYSDFLKPLRRLHHRLNHIKGHHTPVTMCLLTYILKRCDLKGRGLLAHTLIGQWQPGTLQLQRVNITNCSDE